MKYTNLLQAMASAPEAHLDRSICCRLNDLSNKIGVTSDEVLDIIDDCVRSALASDFAIQMLDHLWKLMLKDEGITMAQALMAAEPRRTSKQL